MSFKREREREQVWEGQRERGTEDLKQAPGAELTAESLMWGSNSWTTRSWLEPKSDAQLTEPLRCPTVSPKNPALIRGQAPLYAFDIQSLYVNLHHSQEVGATITLSHRWACQDLEKLRNFPTFTRQQCWAGSQGWWQQGPCFLLPPPIPAMWGFIQSEEGWEFLWS